MIHQKEVAAVIKEKGTPDKIYIGDKDSIEDARKLANEINYNPVRYKGVVVLKYGHKLIEIPDLDKKPAGKKQTDTKKEGSK